MGARARRESNMISPIYHVFARVLQLLTPTQLIATNRPCHLATPIPILSLLCKRCQCHRLFLHWNNICGIALTFLNQHLFREHFLKLFQLAIYIIPRLRQFILILLKFNLHILNLRLHWIIIHHVFASLTLGGLLHGLRVCALEITWFLFQGHIIALTLVINVLVSGLYFI